MRFYYNDQMVRTSKNRHYKFAVVWEREGAETVSCLACSETKENAERSLQREIAAQKRIAQSNLHFHNDPENTESEWYKEYFGADFDAQKAFEDHIESLKNIKVVELREV